MPHLDLYSVRVMTLITVVISSAATLCAWRANSAVRGMSLFSIALLSMSVGSVIGMGAVVYDSYVLMILSWAGRFGGMIMIGQSIRMFRGLRAWPPLVIGLFAAIVWGLFLYFTFGNDSLEIRTGVISIAMATVAVDGATSMFRHVSPRDRLTHWSTGFIFAFVALYLVGRGMTNLAGTKGSLAPVPVEIAATIGSNIAFIGAAFGMLLAANARLRQAAENSALFDPLTGLPNRRFFEGRLLEAEAATLATGRHLGIIYVDLDEFKQVNDTRGHLAGDDVLKKVGHAMSRVLKPGDCLARVGGDEFVVLIEDIGQRSQLENIAGEMRAAIEGISGASYGVAIFPEDGSSIRDVMREADSEMYHAKRRRRRAVKASARA